MLLKINEELNFNFNRMKKLSFLFLIATSIVAFQISCTKTDLSLDQNAVLADLPTETNLTAGQNSDIEELGYASFNEGIFHNELVDLAINHWGICSDDPVDITNEYVRILIDHGQSLVEKHNLDFEEFKSVLNRNEIVSVLENMDNYSIKTLEYWNELGFSSNLASKCLNFTNVVIGEDVSEMKNAINNFYHTNKSSLNKDDLIKFGMMVDVANHSAEFWLATEAGGENRFFDFYNIRSNVCEEEPINQTNSWWSDIILADAVGAVTGAAANIGATAGAGALPNPALGGLPTAGVVGAISGAGASIAKAI